MPGFTKRLCQSIGVRQAALAALFINAVVLITGAAAFAFADTVPLLATGMMGVSGFVMMVVSFCLYRSYKNLEKKFEKQIDVLTEGLTHDFNNLLSPVESYATFLCEDLPPESESRSFAEKIMTALPQMRRVLGQIRQNPYCYETKDVDDNGR